MVRRSAFLFALFAPLFLVLPASAGILEEVRERGLVRCGVNQELPGFARRDASGVWRGLDVDLCRAIAAAVLGEADKAEFVALNAKTRFAALQAGEIDVLVRNTTWTLTRDTVLNLNFAGVNFFDGQGFMVRRSLGLDSARALDGATICVTSGTTTALNLADYFAANGMRYRAMTFEELLDAASAYETGSCDAFTSDRSSLAAFRSLFARPEEHVLLPDSISKEPLGPVVKTGDERWASTVRWTLNALMLAEELGVTKANAEDQVKTTTDPRVRRLLGAEGEFGPMLGLSDDWAKDAIEAVGNYGEIFERNLGSQSTLDLARGLNAQWNARPAGLIYGLPIR